MDEKFGLTPKTQLLNSRITRVNEAVALKEPDKIPLVPFISSVAQRMFDSSYKDIYYNYRRAGDAMVKFYENYPAIDAHSFTGFVSGKANELAGSSMIDWPGRPGTIVSDFSSHQVIEQEYLHPDEYKEFLSDYTGFMLRKYLPRAYPNLKGLDTISYTPTIVLSTSLLAPMYNQAALETYKILAEIAKLDAESAAATNEYYGKLTDIGVPNYFTGASEAPFDILGDYFRGTAGLMLDMFEYEDEIAAACDMFADQQIAALQYFKFVPLPVKRVFFPLHKGMDGFMNPRQYEKLYWKPLKKVVDALIAMDVTPIIWTEGKYNSRLNQLADVQKGKVIYHFEDVDMREAKRILGNIACISGNLPIALLEFGKKEQVVDYCKYLIDTCAPGGGYMLDFSGCLENTKKENLDAMFETFETYK